MTPPVRSLIAPPCNTVRCSPNPLHELRICQCRLIATTRSVSRLRLITAIVHDIVHFSPHESWFLDRVWHPRASAASSNRPVAISEHRLNKKSLNGGTSSCSRLRACKDPSPVALPEPQPQQFLLPCHVCTSHVWCGRITSPFTNSNRKQQCAVCF